MNIKNKKLLIYGLSGIILIGLIILIIFLIVGSNSVSPPHGPPHEPPRGPKEPMSVGTIVLYIIILVISFIIIALLLYKCSNIILKTDSQLLPESESKSYPIKQDIFLATSEKYLLLSSSVKLSLNIP